MTNPEFPNEPIGLSCTINEQGEVSLQKLIWREQPYTIVAVGRQWVEEDGRHLMAEAADGTRFELQLHREDLRWYVGKVWYAQMAA